MMHRFWEPANPWPDTRFINSTRRICGVFVARLSTTPGWCVRGMFQIANYCQIVWRKARFVISTHRRDSTFATAPKPAEVPVLFVGPGI